MGFRIALPMTLGSINDLEKVALFKRGMQIAPQFNQRILCRGESTGNPREGTATCGQNG